MFRAGVVLGTVFDIDPGEPSNIRALLAREYTQAAPQSCCSKEVASMNIPSISVTLDAFHFEISPLNEVALMNMLFMSVTLDTAQSEMSPANATAPMNILFMSTTCETSHFERRPLKDIAPMNMRIMLVTLDTPHFEMSVLNDGASENMLVMRVTLDTSHFEMSPLKFVVANTSLMSITHDTSHFAIGPCGPIEQSALGDSLRDAMMALANSDVDCGEKAEGCVLPGMRIGVLTFADIDPIEPVNMRFLVALEYTQAAPQSRRLNDAACINMRFMEVTFLTSHFEISQLNNDATANIPVISTTSDTSHFEISPWKIVVANTWFMSVTLNTSHSPIGP